MPTGPWLKSLKDALYSQKDLSTVIEAPALNANARPQRYHLGDLASQITRTSAGQKIAYITDVAGHADNRRKIIDLVRGADHLYIESAFRAKDRNLAAVKYHLTAHQAGQIAASADVSRYTLFHFSPRYSEQPDEILAEANQTYLQFSRTNSK